MGVWTTNRRDERSRRPARATTSVSLSVKLNVYLIPPPMVTVLLAYRIFPHILIEDREELSLVQEMGLYTHFEVAKV